MKKLTDYLKEKGLLGRPVDAGRIKIFEDVIGNISNNAEKKTSENTEENVKAKIKKIMDSYGEYSVSLNENGIDLLIKKDEKVRVIFECKKPGSNEMITINDLNKKAIHELILNYIEEYLKNQNKDNVDWLIATNGLKWFVFSKGSFLRSFAENPDFRDLVGIGTLFDIHKRNKKDIYEDIKNYLNNHSAVLQRLDCLYIDTVNNKEFAKELYLLLSPDILLKQFNPNIGNILNKNFYNELLYIVGLQETKDKKIESADVNGSFYQQIIMLLKSKNVPEENIFESALDLLIIWFNRILFLKLFEARLISFNGGNTIFKFMDKSKISDFSKMKQLFFQVLAVPEDARASNLKQPFKDIPYLNSSLFEEKDQESIVSISDISASDSVEYYKHTILRDTNTSKQREGNITLLDYLFDFLDAYDFGTEGQANADLISPAVLGLIFEKINGYKEGSYYTPSEITDFMAEKAIKTAIVNKVNTALNTSWETFEDFENAFFEGHIDKKVVRNILDTLKILDPAVGSGHFLVSALNVLLMIKWKFGFITDSNGQSFKDLYDIEMSYDDLSYKEKETGKIFVYKKPKENGEKQQEFQKAVFNAKKHIIENNLFGVDINPKAVEIARLRMWIELLKNAYYMEASNFNEMETLPNIDINIKEGDSLLAPIADINTGVFTNVSVAHYKELFTQYQNASDKSNKQKIKDEMKKERDILKQGIDTTYDKLIWTVDFPQILDNNGKFIGFDIVMANPPFIDSESMTKSNKKLREAYSNMYMSAKGNWDLYVIFIEKGLYLLAQRGILTYIIPNKFIAARYSEELRKILATKNIIEFRDFSRVDVFKDSDVYPVILFLQNDVCRNHVKMTVMESLNDKIEENEIDPDIFYRDIYWDKYFAPANELKILLKISKRPPLNLAFPKISSASTVSEAYEIKKYIKDEGYSLKNSFKKLINSGTIEPFFSLWGIKKTRYIGDGYQKPIIYDSELNIVSTRRLEQASAKKIIIAGMTRNLECYFDGEGEYLAGKSTTIILENSTNNLSLKFLVAILNSKLISFWFARAFKSLVLAGGYLCISENEIKQIPIPTITSADKSFVQQIESLVDQILTVKKQTPNADTSAIEKQIDQFIYELYDLTEEEVRIVENN